MILEKSLACVIIKKKSKYKGVSMLNEGQLEQISRAVELDELGVFVASNLK
ncbi:hypothetical protein [Clostridium estertheticum]|uniref:hypothetical protein n=1 Tax=Clostridium estertheticum TaxID=238834 RepID=UPI0027152293|nr:hypothetical protein [Clostridium estertheticum]WLC78873.1 hypothetical protein KTC98_17000 [Clostridium estertheticum]